ncbi:hypothetical protein MBM_01152 [Drepanopeziza brunnea f. sp. 'multigermtubi' MB_m1]|uniref:Uncharacterized protein n=1 Tax=Marssonina brunnea f. sp. multigermtubi (strain MB_m1) TaxID=1072389 RepID=K1WS55_MARBU|nr:uncharacterized protein MBM_01152 [Drepanopeziza brunnea f. sp. 'multigermtubi' MB_m1]EKD20470.1 hypothetical protein MBM_01152 [Drepanopeziza brunnea f. sp. 'multigermtubi' MB_m1]
MPGWLRTLGRSGFTARTMEESGPDMYVRSCEVLALEMAWRVERALGILSPEQLTEDATVRKVPQHASASKRERERESLDWYVGKAKKQA